MMPEPEVRPEARPVPKRRTFTSKYKLRILAESSQNTQEMATQTEALPAFPGTLPGEQAVSRGGSCLPTCESP